MSTDHDIARSLRSWLHEDAHENADRVLDSVLDQLDTTPQRRAAWLARRFPLMKNTFRMVLVAAAVVIVAVIGYQFLPASNTGGPGATPTPEPTATSAPTATPAAADFPQPGPVTVGRHPIKLVGLQASIEVTTTGWISNGQWGIDMGNWGSPGSASFIFWPASAPDNVFADPCTETLLSPAPGSSAAELAAAVATIPGINLVSGPSEVTVGGYAAQLVVFTVPEEIGCAPDQFYLWEDLDTPGAARYATQPGETFYIWIIDVNGAIVWIDGETYAASGPDAAREVQQIVDSIRFE